MRLCGWVAVGVCVCVWLNAEEKMCVFVETVGGKRVVASWVLVNGVFMEFV